jgi:hypothetical protein
MKVKYIRTKSNAIIVFSELQQHREFEKFEPVSAGFIAIGTKKVKYGEQVYHEVDCTCYGESISLGLKANEVEDTKLARRQILNMID